MILRQLDIICLCAHHLPAAQLHFQEQSLGARAATLRVTLLHLRQPTLRICQYAGVRLSALSGCLRVARVSSCWNKQRNHQLRLSYSSTLTVCVRRLGALAQGIACVHETTRLLPVHPKKPTTYQRGGMPAYGGMQNG